MKRLKRIICLCLAFAIVMSGFVAFAESRRINPRHIKKPINRMTENTVMLYDFATSEVGGTPVGFGAGANITVEEYDVGNGRKKNCMVIEDTSHNSDYTGPLTSASLAATDGPTSIEIRYKYLPSGTSTYASVIIGFDQNNKRLARFTTASANGYSIYCDKNNLESSRIFHDTWYTLKVIFDFDEGVSDVYLTNEATGVTKNARNVEWYTGGINFTSVDKFVFQGSSYGGIWVIDYVRQEKDAERNTLDGTIEKGCPQINIPSPVSRPVEDRTNITLDGKYKYTTLAPVVEDGKVYATAKNIARILGLVYTEKNGEGVISSAKKEYKLNVNTKSADGQIMTSIEDVAKEFGIGYEYNAETNTVVLTTGKEAE